jgi:hypothetical protein
MIPAALLDVTSKREETGQYQCDANPGAGGVRRPEDRHCRAGDTLIRPTLPGGACTPHALGRGVLRRVYGEAERGFRGKRIVRRG